ncbi:hypothetical protein [Thioclava sp. F36-7]|uniref:hypothetical protein n=1 Tax=Thioclava sp. F36-7 TaxID=1915317 RepID=UPI000997479F|nr:hypothetical protein [Thioclava sp. F36-7]OOY09215.1 hypothetical protein BMI89_09745 [Thioclava sp. F36-7]
MTRLSLVFAVAPLALSALPAFAFDAADRNAVTQEVAGFTKAVDEKDYSVFFDTVPPKMMQAIADQTGVPKEQLEDIMRKQINDAMASVTIDDFEMNIAAMKTGETSSGRAYAQIPTSTVMEVPDMGKVRSTNTTLALQDGEEWYLVRIDSPAQIAVLRKVYPDFEGIEFPKGTMEAVR